MVRGPGQLWIAANAVTQPAYRGYATIEAAAPQGWVPMPPFEPAGQALLADAKRALTTTSAVAALDATAASTDAARPAARALCAGNGADRRLRPPAHPPRLFETIRPAGPAGEQARTQGRRSRSGHPPGLGLADDPDHLTPPSGPVGRDAWALTRRISPRRVVRAAALDADGRRSTPTRCSTRCRGPRPRTPWAVHLADAEGRFHLLCADLDAKTIPQAAAADASRLAGLLDEVGIVPHVVCASGPTGGRHVWLALREPVDAVLVGALAHLLKAWLPTLDVSPLLNPASGCVRPPGAPHRLGGTSRVLAGSASVLTHPTVTAGPGPRPGRPPRRARPRNAGPAVVRAASGRRGGRDAVPARPEAAAVSGVPDRARDAVPTGDLSAVLWRVLCGAAAARWRFEDLAAIADAPGLEHARTLRTGATRSPRPPPARRPRRPCCAASGPAPSTRSPNWPPIRPRRARRAFDARAETVAELVRAVQHRADATAGRWGSSRAGLAQRRVLDALCLYHLQAVRPDEVEADIRRLALTCGLDRETARRALLALAADGWIARTHPSVGRRGAHWTIDPAGAVHTRISRMLSQAVPRPAGTGAALRSTLEHELAHRLTSSAHDAFAPRGGLGLEAGSIYGRSTPPPPRWSAARLMGWTIVKTTRVLERLASHGLLDVRRRLLAAGRRRSI